MRNMLVSEERDNAEFKFIVYNVVFSESSGTFTTDAIYKQLQNYKIPTERSRLERLFEQ